MRKYEFSWDLLGNMEDGRPHLGSTIGLDVYRLMMFTLRDVMETRLSTEATDRLFYEAGSKAGYYFYHAFIQPVASLDEFISKSQRVLQAKHMGILKVEEVDSEQQKVTLTIDEDLDCSGLPEMDYETCIYDEGFLAALFEAFTGKPWYAKEIDCWCTGARTCRFLIQQEPF